MHKYQSGAMSDDMAKFLLRVTLAILILFHGVSKIMGSIGPITGMVAKVGMPPALGYLVFIGEVLAPLLVLVGAWTRPAAFIIAINMVVAVLLAHTTQFFSVSKTGGWALELQAMYFISAIVVTLLGGGRFGVGGKWN
ncbi:MAG TPA: DoxX family protein [Noviherbaspirillum sp.]|uniref:DoxX family protein n=1 Tax=Noviherbaspirillum sp. TaxID=1926288 RepID=UPI002B45B612|nr:DoxX family protein [Noviherbaspirillum sp.]HJV85443.1 DoxX family protein [Noviherbaspirillum sp.]